LDQLMTQMVQRMQAAGLAESEAHVQDGMRARAAETSDLSAREQAAQERLPSSQTGDKRSRMEEATMGRASAGQSELAFSSG
jgi:hypothetical protein